MTVAQSEALALGADAFSALAEIARKESGLELLPEKRLMVQSRLKPRVRALQMTDIEDYAKHLKSESGQSELRNMISALTTNVTHFFRENHHFDQLTEQMIPVFRRKIENGERIRIWSAGCSKGQEPYSIAIHLLHALPQLEGADFRILATDIDPKVVTFARQGQYDAKEVEARPEHYTNSFFEPGSEPGQLSVTKRVREHITFNELNLMHAWPMTGTFDVIFCRNVVIYFNVDTQEKLWPRFANALQPDGLLFLGHSERIAVPTACGLQTAGTTSYEHNTDCTPRSTKL